MTFFLQFFSATSMVRIKKKKCSLANWLRSTFFFSFKLERQSYFDHFSPYQEIGSLNIFVCFLNINISFLGRKMKNESVEGNHVDIEEEEVDLVGNGDDIVIVTIITLLALIWQMSFYGNFCSC